MYVRMNRFVLNHQYKRTWEELRGMRKCQPNINNNNNNKRF